MMNTLWIIIIVGFVLTYLVIEFVNAWADRRAMRGLEEAYKREAALIVLTRFSQSEKGTDRCTSCNQPVLVENTERGICSDCFGVALGLVMDYGFEHTALPNPDAEWADIMRAIEDEQRDTEDHR